MKINKNKLTALLGIAIFIFTIVGIVSTISFATKSITGLIENNEQKQMFSRYLFPVVMVDPTDFSNIKDLDQKTILSAAIWKIVLNKEYKGTPDEYGMVNIHKTEVEKSATDLFGKGIVFNHQTMADANSLMSYNQENGSYFVSTSPNFLPNMPRIDKIKKANDKYILTVSYIPTSSIWTSLTKTIDLKNIKFEKKCEYVVEKSNKKFRIVSITYLESGSDNQKTQKQVYTSQVETSQPNESKTENRDT